MNDEALAVMTAALREQDGMNSPRSRVSARPVLAALEAAGFTVARLEQIGVAVEALPGVWDFLDSNHPDETDVPVFRIIPEETP